MSRRRVYLWGRLKHPGSWFIWSDEADEMNLRSAACKFAKRKGIVIRCERLPAGILVTYARNRPLV